MRKLPQAEAGYWLDSFPIDLAVGLAYGVPTGLLCGAACYFLSIRYLAQHHTLDPAQHGIASLFLAGIFTIAGTFFAALLVFLFRFFRHLYRNPL